jgi:hypothetical protein
LYGKDDVHAGDEPKDKKVMFVLEKVVVLDKLDRVVYIAAS